jgi:hypothetical protein
MAPFSPKNLEKSSKPIILDNCPVCDAKIGKGGHVQPGGDRFKCTGCGLMILNSNNNRCTFCKKLFTDSTTLSEHVFFDHKDERAKQCLS